MKRNWKEEDKDNAELEEYKSRDKQVPKANKSPIAH